MATSAGILVITAAFLGIFAFRRGGSPLVKSGIATGFKTAKGIVPLLLLAFVASGLMEVAVPTGFIRSLLGEEAGLRGILIGMVAGAIIPGGPYVSFPIIASVFQAGATIGAAVAFVTGWAVLGIGMVPYELAFLGPRFTLVRYSISILVPPICGFIAAAIFG